MGYRFPISKAWRSGAIFLGLSPVLMASHWAHADFRGVASSQTGRSSGVSSSEGGSERAPLPIAADRSRYGEIQNLYSKSAFTKVIQLAEDFERDFPTSSKLPEVLNLKGLAWLLTQDSERAAQAFTLALSRAPE
ncbi:MAG: hypothetical protein RJB38_355, partial [Pseudomonadota bacterium]